MTAQPEDTALPGMEEIAEHNRITRDELAESARADVVECCLRLINYENKHGITARSFCVLQLETAIKRLKAHGRS